MPTDRLRTVHRIADRQLGLLTRDDLRRAGLSERQISHLQRTGVIIRVHRAVFRTPGSALSIEQQALAACLAIGPHAIASHTTAAQLWGLVERTGKRRPEVSVPRAHRSEQRDIVAHRPLHLRRDEITRVGRIPVTRVARTLSDLRSVDLEDALDEALRRKLVTPAQLARYPRLRPFADDRQALGVPESRLERLAIALIRRYGLPEPSRQHKVDRYRIDLAYPEHRVAIELEGRAPHYGRERWQADHDRRNALELAGWRVLSFTWWDITEKPIGTAARIGDALGLVPTRWGAREARSRWRRGR